MVSTVIYNDPVIHRLNCTVRGAVCLGLTELISPGSATDIESGLDEARSMLTFLITYLRFRKTLHAASKRLHF